MRELSSRLDLGRGRLASIVHHQPLFRLAHNSSMRERLESLLDIPERQAKLTKRRRSNSVIDRGFLRKGCELTFRGGSNAARAFGIISAKLEKHDLERKMRQLNQRIVVF